MSSSITFYQKDPSCGIPDSYEAACNTTYRKAGGPIPSSEFDSFAEAVEHFKQLHELHPGDMFIAQDSQVGRSACLILLPHDFYAKYFRAGEVRQGINVDAQYRAVLLKRTVAVHCV